MMSLVERFEAKYIPEPMSGCWLWIGGLHSKNYGMFTWGRKQKILAHRASWMLHKGELSPALDVLHKCDVPGCVNPDHLFVGTHQDNMTDMKVKGRARAPQGTAHPKSKLTDDLVREIRVSKETNVALGKRIGVSNVLVSMVRLGKIWKHVQ